MTAEETKTKAPISAEFAATMKERFGEAKLVRVNEGEIQSKPDPGVYATCFYGGSGKPIAEFLK